MRGRGGTGKCRRRLTDTRSIGSKGRGSLGRVRTHGLFGICRRGACTGRGLRGLGGPVGRTLGPDHPNFRARSCCYNKILARISQRVEQKPGGRIMISRGGWLSSLRALAVLSLLRRFLFSLPLVSCCIVRVRGDLPSSRRRLPNGCPCLSALPVSPRPFFDPASQLITPLQPCMYAAILAASRPLGSGWWPPQ